MAARILRKRPPRGRGLPALRNARAWLLDAVGEAIEHHTESIRCAVSVPSAVVQVVAKSRCFMLAAFAVRLREREFVVSYPSTAPQSVGLTGVWCGETVLQRFLATPSEHDPTDSLDVPFGTLPVACRFGCWSMVFDSC
jgi:hypothetical protein